LPATVETAAREKLTLVAVVSNATGHVTFEWQKDNGAKAFSPIPDAPDSPIFTIESLEVGDAGFYRCQVGDSVTAAASSPVQVVVAEGTPVARHPGTGVLLVILIAAGLYALRRRVVRQN
jgi:hypothetical protein